MTDDTASSTLPREPIGNETVETSDATRLVAAPLVSVLMITYNHAGYVAA